MKFLFCAFFLSISCFSSFSQKKEKDSVSVHLDQFRLDNDAKRFEKVFTQHTIKLYRSKKYEKAVQTYSIYKDYINSCLPTYNIPIHKIQFYLGLCYYKLKQYNESIFLFERVANTKYTHKFSIYVFAELGRCYRQKGDFHKALQYFEFAESNFIKTKKWKNAIGVCMQAGDTFRSIASEQSYKKAEEKYLKADSILQLTKQSYRTTYNVKSGLAEVYNHNETLNIPKAIYYLEQAKILAEKEFDSITLSRIFGNMGNVYNTTNPDRSIHFQKKSLSIVNSQDTLQLWRINSNLAFAYGQKMVYDKSISYYKKAITLLTNKTVPILKSFEKSGYKKLLLLNHMELGAILLKKYHSNKNDVKSLRNALEAFKIADQLIDLFLIESRKFQSKLFWRKQSSELYSRAIEVCYLIGDAEQAFFFMEKNKAMLLTKELKNQQLKKGLSLPDSVVNREISLKRKLYTLQRKHVEGNDVTAMALLTHQRALEKLQDSITNKFAMYESLKTQSTIKSLSQVQQSLDSESIILMYNMGTYDDYNVITKVNTYVPVIKSSKYGVKTLFPSYGLLISKEGVDFFELDINERFKEKSRELRALMSAPFETQTELANYQQLSLEIFNILLPSKQLKDKIARKKLRIIPDNYLNYLPFEALITDQSDLQSYWLKKNEISYAYSNSFLQNIKETKKSSESSFVGFAPIEFENLQLEMLQNTSNELNAIFAHFSGTNYLHESATKTNFLEQVSNYDIIHLATHADAQDSIAPWIAFHDKKLLVDELLFTKNKAKLVVLSGCNTLLGKHEKGEGIMSLSRGFFQAGAKSVVSSLWNVNDKATSKLMRTFYEGLKNGDSKAKSLRAAKLEYLEHHKSEKASPYYWASFVLSGDPSPLAEEPISNVFFWTLLVLLLVITLAFLMSKRYSHTSK